jgi:hypothetical protein
MMYLISLCRGGVETPLCVTDNGKETEEKLKEWILDFPVDDDWGVPYTGRPRHYDPDCKAWQAWLEENPIGADPGFLVSEIFETMHDLDITYVKVTEVLVA